MYCELRNITQYGSSTLNLLLSRPSSVPPFFRSSLSRSPSSVPPFLSPRFLAFPISSSPNSVLHPSLSSKMQFSWHYPGATNVEVELLRLPLRPTDYFTLPLTRTLTIAIPSLASVAVAFRCDRDPPGLEGKHLQLEVETRSRMTCQLLNAGCAEPLSSYKPIHLQTPQCLKLAPITLEQRYQANPHG